MSKVYKKRKIKGKTTPIPSRYALPIIQSASEENNDTMQALWAGLIVNATDPNKKLNLTKVFINILKSMEPADVEILRFLSKQGWNMVPSAGGGINAKMLSATLQLSEADVLISLQNLRRLGCMSAELKNPLGNDLAQPDFGLIVNNERAAFRPTSLAYSLLEACEIEGEMDNE